MTLNFVIPEMTIGGAGTPPLRFFKRGFSIGGSGSTPSWRNVVISGVGALTLVNAKANGLNYVKAFGACEQNGTPTPTNPIDIVCNNGVVKVSKNLYNEASRVNGANIYSTGVVYTAERYAYSALIPVIVGETYTFSGVSNITPSAKRIHGYNNSGTWVEQLGAESTSVGSYSLTVTIPSGVSQIRICGIRIDGSNADTNVQFEQGSTATDYMSYGEIYTDGTVETITITGKNLFNKNSTENVEGWWNVQNQIVGQPLKTLGSSVSVNTSHPIRVYPNQTYTLVGLAGTSPSFLYLDKDMNFVSGFANSNSKTKTITVPDDDSIMYLRFPYSPTSVDTVQMEYGDTATDYAPYLNGGTATCENLFAVGEIKDIQSILNGDATRKVGVKALDGTQGALSGTMFYIPSPAFSDMLSGRNNPGFCTHAKVLKTGDSASNNIRLGNNNTSLYWYSFSTDTGVTTTEEALAWLADQYANGTPVIIVYPLATATTQTVTAQPLSIQEGTNIVTATGSIDDLSIEVSYKAGVEVTITEVENAQLDDTVTVRIGG